MAGGFSIAIENRRSEVPRLIGGVAGYFRAEGCPKAVLGELELLLEEWLTNVISYGFPTSASGRILAKASLKDDLMEVRISDSGTPFDPRQVPAPDLSLPLEERPIGGLGVHMIKRLADGLEYERRDGFNHVTFRKSFTKAKLQGSD
jgi:anti-sigma regulatory factor (Ser/Thr protein kinase)